LPFLLLEDPAAVSLLPSLVPLADAVAWKHRGMDLLLKLPLKVLVSPVLALDSNALLLLLFIIFIALLILI